MKRSRFSEEQIIGILKVHQAGLGAKELYRKHRISDATFYKWRSTTFIAGRADARSGISQPVTINPGRGITEREIHLRNGSKLFKRTEPPLFADSVGLGVAKKGNETWYDIPAPNGYFLCRLYLKTRSVAPQDEHDSPIFDLTANQDGISVYTFIDPPTITEGGNACWDGELVGYYPKRAGREWRLLNDGDSYEPRVNRLLDTEKSPGYVFDNGFQIRYACKSAGNPRDGHPACDDGWLHSDLATSSHYSAPNLP